MWIERLMAGISHQHVLSYNPFLLTGKVRIVFPSVISIGMGVLMLIGLVLFKGKEMRQEMEKNLHV